MVASKTGNRKRKANIIILSLASLAFIFIVLYSSILSSLTNFYFLYPFEAYGVYGKFDKATSEEMNSNILGFLKHENELNREYFMDSEISHLDDVRILMEKLHLSFIISVLAIGVLLLYYGREIFSAAYFSVLILLFLISAYWLIGFERFFLMFHEAFFEGNYAFDPAISNMKAIYPDGLFMYFSILIFIKMLLKLLCIGMTWKYLYSITEK